MRFLLKSCRSVPARFYLTAIGLFCTLSLATRVALLVGAWHDVAWNVSLAGALACGVCFDVSAGLFAGLPWLLLGLLAPVRFLRSVAGRVVVACLMTVFSALLVFISVSEWFFWDEFGARFNFIAVDYLVWTQEVLGNIMESYPMGIIGTGIVLAGMAVTWGLHKVGVISWAVNGEAGLPGRLGGALAGGVLAALAWSGVNQAALPEFANQFNLEVAKNGPWSFFAAFRQMEIDYTKWYPTLPEEEAVTRAKEMLATPGEVPAPAVKDMTRTITKSGEEHRWNVILVCLESHSGDYMKYAGDKLGLSPNLDRLAEQSVFFENLYATGTRTVRGMEALTLNLPPTPGQAIIYRPEGTHLVSTFTPFTKRGYDCAFFYGGDGRFDFMNRYFSTAGCRIMDVTAWEEKDTTFKTSWGACDEDMFNKVLSEADRNFAEKKPFHYFCMTTSNHRPFDFPEDRVPLPNHSRRGAVQYADWAVGDLIRKAEGRPWFKDTLFVICADHCSGSAGKTELDVTKFHIPAMIYNPELVPAEKVGALCSQIDVMPTVFGLLNWSHETLGYGHDRLAETPPPERAFVSNYQKIGLLRKDGLAILKPKRTFSVYDYDPEQNLLAPKGGAGAQELVRDATAFYQSASWLFKSGKLKNPAAAGNGAP